MPRTANLYGKKRQESKMNLHGQVREHGREDNVENGFDVPPAAEPEGAGEPQAARPKYNDEWEVVK